MIEGKKKPVPPCKKDCPDRYPGCGAKCEKWQAYTKARNAYYQDILHEIQANEMSKEVRKRSMRATRYAKTKGKGR